MPEIFAMKPTKRGGRMLLKLSDGTDLRVTKEIAAELGLKAGSMLTEAQVETLRAHGGIRADEAAAMIISHHPLSKRELAGKLADRGYTEEEIGEAMEKLGEYGMVDDAAYAAAITERAAGKNMSRRALLFELNRRGIDKDTALAAAEELPDAADALDALVEARMKGAVPDRSLNEKTYRYLAGKGFAPGEIRGALRRYAVRRGGEWADED